MSNKKGVPTYAEIFVRYLNERDSKNIGEADELFQKIREWSVLSNNISFFVGKMYQRYGMVMCSPLYSIVSEETMLKDMTERTLIRLRDYPTRLMSKELMEKPAGNTELINKKVMYFLKIKMYEEWNVLLVERVRCFYPDLTVSHLKDYIRLRKAGVDFSDADEKWIKAIYDYYARSWSVKKCYNLRKAFLPQGGVLENESQYAAFFQRGFQITQVRNWQKRHSRNNTIEACIMSLDKIPEDVIREAWDPDLVSGNNKPEGSQQRKRRLATEWRMEHPDGTIHQCVTELGISEPTVRKCWRKLKAQTLIKAWKLEHPAGTMEQCAAELSIENMEEVWDMVSLDLSVQETA